MNNEELIISEPKPKYFFITSNHLRRFTILVTQDQGAIFLFYFLS